MSKLVTVQLLVDSDESNAIADRLHRMLREAAHRASPGDDTAKSWLLDWRLTWGAGECVQLLVQDPPPSVTEAVANRTYCQGDAFHGHDVQLLPGVEYAMIASGPKAMDYLWLTVPSLRPEGEGGDLTVSIKRTAEGVIVDVCSSNDGAVLDTAACEFSDSI